MTLWEHIYDLRRKGLIPREWKRAHLRPHLEKPQGPFSRNTIATSPSNQSLNVDGGGEPGDYVKRGQSPKAWRVATGRFRLIVDPDDDTKTQDAEFARARHLVGLGLPRAPSKALPIPTRRSRMQVLPPDQPGSYCTQERMELVLDRLKRVESVLGKYDYVQRSLHACKVVTNTAYRSAFIGYYRMGFRSPRWYDMFFSILEREKRGDKVSFRTVLLEILRETGRLEASFSSKLVATISDNCPVWDRYVLDNLGLRAPFWSPDSERRLQRCVELYSNIQSWSSRVIQQDGFWEWRSRFDRLFPHFWHFSDIKKLDLLLWQSR